MQVDVVNIVPNRLEDYVELQLEEVNPALQQAGVPWRSVWRVAEFGNSYEVQLVTPMSSLAQYDTGGPLARVLQPDRRLRLVDRLRRLTVSRRRYAMRYRPEMSVEADDVGGLSLARVTTVQVAPGRTALWEDFLRSSLPKFSDANLCLRGVRARLRTWTCILADRRELRQLCAAGAAFARRARLRRGSRRHHRPPRRRAHVDRADGAALRRGAELFRHPGKHTVAIHGVAACRFSFYQVVHLFSAIMLAGIAFAALANPLPERRRSILIFSGRRRAPHAGERLWFAGNRPLRIPGLDVGQGGGVGGAGSHRPASPSAARNRRCRWRSSLRLRCCSRSARRY